MMYPSLRDVTVSSQVDAEGDHRKVLLYKGVPKQGLCFMCETNKPVDGCGRCAAVLRCELRAQDQLEAVQVLLKEAEVEQGVKRILGKEVVLPHGGAPTAVPVHLLGEGAPKWQGGAPVRSHPLNKDGIAMTNLLHFLARRSSKTKQRGCPVRIPDTVVLDGNAVRGWYCYDEETSETRRMKNTDATNIVTHFLGAPESGNSGESEGGEIVAVHLFGGGSSPNPGSVGADFLRRDELAEFLLRTDKKGNSVLQRFVPPRGDKNSTITATWSPCCTPKVVHGVPQKCSPGYFQCVQLVSNTPMWSRAPPYERAVTWEGSVVWSRIINTSSKLRFRLQRECERVAEHLAAVECGVSVAGMQAHFKVDADDRLWLLWVTSCRVRFGPRVGLPEAPVLGGQLVQTQPDFHDASSGVPLPAEHQSLLVLLDMDGLFFPHPQRGPAPSTVEALRTMEAEHCRVALLSARPRALAAEAAASCGAGPRDLVVHDFRGWREHGSIAEGGQRGAVHAPTSLLAAQEGAVSGVFPRVLIFERAPDAARAFRRNTVLVDVDPSSAADCYAVPRAIAFCAGCLARPLRRATVASTAVAAAAAAAATAAARLPADRALPCYMFEWYPAKPVVRTALVGAVDPLLRGTTRVAGASLRDVGCHRIPVLLPATAQAMLGWAAEAVVCCAAWSVCCIERAREKRLIREKVKAAAGSSSSSPHRELRSTTSAGGALPLASSPGAGAAPGQPEGSKRFTLEEEDLYPRAWASIEFARFPAAVRRKFDNLVAGVPAGGWPEKKEQHAGDGQLLDWEKAQIRERRVWLARLQQKCQEKQERLRDGLRLDAPRCRTRPAAHRPDLGSPRASPPVSPQSAQLERSLLLLEDHPPDEPPMCVWEHGGCAGDSPSQSPPQRGPTASPPRRSDARSPDAQSPGASPGASPRLSPRRMSPRASLSGSPLSPRSLGFTSPRALVRRLSRRSSAASAGGRSWFKHPSPPAGPVSPAAASSQEEPLEQQLRQVHYRAVSLFSSNPEARTLRFELHLGLVDVHRHRAVLDALADACCRCASAGPCTCPALLRQLDPIVPGGVLQPLAIEGEDLAAEHAIRRAAAAAREEGDCAAPLAALIHEDPDDATESPVYAYEVHRPAVLVDLHVLFRNLISVAGADRQVQLDASTGGRRVKTTFVSTGAFAASIDP